MMKWLRRAMGTRSASNSASASGLSTCLVRDTFCRWSSPKRLPAPSPSLSALRSLALTGCGGSGEAEMSRYDDTFVDRFLEPWNRNDVDGALALMTDDCVWEVTRGREPHGTLYTGQTAVRSAIVEAFKALPDVNYQPVRNSFGEDHVVVELLVTGTLGDGSKARFHACDILTLRDGLIAAWRAYRKVVE